MEQARQKWHFGEELLSALRHARHVAVLTGAGISAESGVPTFRDALTGMWSQYNPEQLATPDAFARDPRLVWEWYAWRRQLVADVAPNAGHRALVTMAERVPALTLITQNVDSLHQRAGSKEVLELHGNLARVKCSVEGSIIEQWEEGDAVPPHCPQCGALLRPDVVWFGEQLPAQELQLAAQAANSCDIFFSIGTSGVVEPAASLARLALRRGARVVLINPEATSLLTEGVDFLQAPAGEILPALVEAAWP